MTRCFLLISCALMLFAACHKDHEGNDEPKVNERVVMVYMAGDNDLNSFIASDIRQMMSGSEQLAKNQRLIVFVDNYGRKPYVLEVAHGDTVRLKTYDEELKTSDAQVLRQSLLWTMEHYEANSYGLVLWGHADAWVVKNRRAAASGQRRAYGRDVTGSDGWMEIADMAQALQSLPRPLHFIFADCCCFQCVESAYELRNVTDYIIGSAAEIPGYGAPYQTVVPALFSKKEMFYEDVVNAYYDQVIEGCKVPLSVVKTSELENLAAATSTVLQASVTPLVDGVGYPDVDSLIYYYDNAQFDMNDFMLRIADDSHYTEWKKVFDAAVPYKLMATEWVANHVAHDENNYRSLDFEVTAERYGGVSMFVAQNVANGKTVVGQRFLLQLNNTISSMQWYKAANLDLLGW